MATYQISASSDDAYVADGIDNQIVLDHTENPIGAGSANYHKQGSALRFLNITIPQGATIDTAKLTLTAAVALSGTVVNSKISAEDTDDAATWSTKADYDTRFANHTTAIVSWDGIGAWTVDTEYDSPDISTVIQEIVDRAGWASGNDIAIFWEDSDDRSSYLRKAYSYDASSAKAPKLVITYTAATTTSNFFLLF